MSDLITVPTENWEYAKKCVEVVQRLKDRKKELLVLMKSEYPKEDLGERAYKDLFHELEKIFRVRKNDLFML